MDSSYYLFLIAIGVALIGFLIWYSRSWLSSPATTEFYPAKFSLDIATLDDLTVLRAEGRLATSHISQLRKAIESQLAQGRIKMVLDFSDIAIDEEGIAELISIYSYVRNAGAKMAIVRSDTAKILEDFELGELFPSLHDSVDDAARHLGRI